MWGDICREVQNCPHLAWEIVESFKCHPLANLVKSKFEPPPPPDPACKFWGWSLASRKFLTSGFSLPLRSCCTGRWWVSLKCPKKKIHKRYELWHWLTVNRSAYPQQMAVTVQSSNSQQTVILPGHWQCALQSDRVEPSVILCLTGSHSTVTAQSQHSHSAVLINIFGTWLPCDCMDALW